MSDTIFALATPPGRGAIAILRLSGPACAPTLRTLTGGALPEPRRASLRVLRGTDGEPVDQGVVIWSPAPASYTGEDTAELHLHGGVAVVSAMADLLAGQGLRPAEAGEFTRRAFAHGRVDLTQAEAIADLVEAETQTQRRQALAQLGGALTARYEDWRKSILEILALLEASIDFPDEEMPDALEQMREDALRSLARSVGAAASDVAGERVRHGVRIALIGAPNVGKSSLLNALLQRDAAIVTPIPGTTRDVVEGAMVLGGQLAIFADTAGLRSTTDVIEAEGVRRATVWASEADIRIGVVDAGRPETLDAVTEFLRVGDLVAVNKTDLERLEAPEPPSVGVVHTSALHGETSELSAALLGRVTALTARREFPAVTQARHRALIRDMLDHLERAVRNLQLGPELVGEDVRLALRTLEGITGRTDPEAVLDRVFATFCIGK